MPEATAFIHAAQEDFGIAMAKSLACGTPVIALGDGGATEIVRGLDNASPTGVLFQEQSVAAIVGGVRCFLANRGRFTPHSCRDSVLHLDETRFREQYRSHVEAAWQAFCCDRMPTAAQ